MSQDIVAIIVTAIAVAFGVFRTLSISQSSDYDVTRYTENESNFDFGMASKLLVVVGIGLIVWLVCGGFGKPIGAPPAAPSLSSSPSTTADWSSSHSNNRGWLRGYLARNPLTLIKPSH